MGANPRGKAGEDYAADALQAAGYAILARNWHSRYGEVDLVALKDDEICFVEVKTRRRGAMVSGAQAVSAAKQRKIIQTALLYLQEHPEYDVQMRFDLFTVETDGRGKILAHEHMKGAFDGEAYSRPSGD